MGDFFLCFAESLERFSRPEILEGELWGNRGYSRDNRNYSDNSGYRIFLLLDVLGELGALLFRFFQSGD